MTFEIFNKTEQSTAPRIRLPSDKPLKGGTDFFEVLAGGHLSNSAANLRSDVENQVSDPFVEDTIFEEVPSSLVPNDRIHTSDEVGVQEKIFSTKTKDLAGGFLELVPPPETERQPEGFVTSAITDKSETLEFASDLVPSVPQGTQNRVVEVSETGNVEPIGHWHVKDTSSRLEVTGHEGANSADERQPPASVLPVQQTHPVDMTSDDPNAQACGSKSQPRKAHADPEMFRGDMNILDIDHLLVSRREGNVAPLPLAFNMAQGMVNHRLDGVGTSALATHWQQTEIGTKGNGALFSGIPNKVGDLTTEDPPQFSLAMEGLADNRAINGREIGVRPTGTFAASVTQQIASQAQIALSRDSQGVELRLNPAELGRVRIALHHGDTGSVGLVLTIERPETLDLLRRNTALLLAEFKGAGFADLSFEFRQENQTSYQKWKTHDDDLPGSELTPELSAGPQAIYRRAVTSKSGLDIVI